eukprot:2711584-Prymnesium_polylepis.1
MRDLRACGVAGGRARERAPPAAHPEGRAAWLGHVRTRPRVPALGRGAIRIVCAWANSPRRGAQSGTRWMCARVRSPCSRA